MKKFFQLFCAAGIFILLIGAFLSVIWLILLGFQYIFNFPEKVGIMEVLSAYAILVITRGFFIPAMKKFTKSLKAQQVG